MIPSCIPRYGFFGTYTKFTWHKNQSIRSTVKVYFDGKPVAEKIKFQQPIALNGSYTFINRAAMCPLVIDKIQNMAYQSSHRHISFIIQILDNTAQQTLLTVAIIIKHGPPKKYLFPEAPEVYFNESRGEISYSRPLAIPLSQQPLSISPLSEPKVQITPIYSNTFSPQTNPVSTENSSYLQYEKYQTETISSGQSPMFSDADNNSFN